MKFFKKLMKYFINRINIFFSLNINRPLLSDKFFFGTSQKKIINMVNLCNEFSMTGKARMHSLSQAVEYIKNLKLKGDFVECGVWKGGNLLLLNMLNNYYNLDKSIYGFDTFEGMTLPSKEDYDLNNISAKEQLKNIHKTSQKRNLWCYSSLEDVKKNIKKHGKINNIKLIKGPVEKTLLQKDNLPKKISLLRLDTDFYKSTKIELEILYPLLVKNGVLIVDDYGHWKGAKKAVDEYFKSKFHWLHRVDYTCVYLIKNN
jgi:O-methyltransferase